MTAFLVAAVLVTVAIGELAKSPGSRWSEGYPRWLALTGIVVAASSRDLLWVFVGFELSGFSKRPVRPRTVAISLVGLAGLVAISIWGGGTDLARSADAWPARLGLVLVLVSLGARWLASWRQALDVFAGLGVALAGVWVRVVGWAPDATLALEPSLRTASMLIMIAGGTVAAFGREPQDFARATVVFTVGLAAFASLSGPLAVPYVLVHLATSMIAIQLLVVRRSRWATGLALMSLASIPPLPGFVSKFPLLAPLTALPLAVSLLSSALVAFGCARWLEALVLEASPPSEEATRSWVWSMLAMALVVLGGLAPERMFALAAWAATVF